MTKEKLQDEVKRLESENKRLSRVFFILHKMIDNVAEVYRSDLYEDCEYNRGIIEVLTKIILLFNQYMPRYKIKPIREANVFKIINGDGKNDKK